MSKDLKQPIKGARDLYPGDFAVRNWVFSKCKDTAQKFGFEEIDGPILENFDLFSVKSGDELVNQQMYILSDRDNNKLGIRPEITPTYSRMVAKKQGELVFPLRWMMFGNVWRYEKPQTGRSRDFWQWELNIIGGSETAADAEILVLAIESMKSLGLTSNEVIFRINDRRYMQKSLTSIGITNDIYQKVIKTIDRKSKISDEEFIKSLQEINIKKETINKLSEFLNNTGYQNSTELSSLFEMLENYGISDFVKYDPLVVRGITYYTGMVFECFDKKGELRSIFGGGRFDDLVETFGGGKIPAAGFAMGDVVITELLKRLNKLPNIKPSPTRVLVTVFSPNLYNDSLKFSLKLRKQGINCELYPDPDAKLDKQLKYADKKEIPFAAILGPEEIKSDTVTIKNLKAQTQKKIFSNAVASLLNN